jgi:hypothetical protein
MKGALRRGRYPRDVPDQAAAKEPKPGTADNRWKLRYDNAVEGTTGPWGQPGVGRAGGSIYGACWGDLPWYGSAVKICGLDKVERVGFERYRLDVGSRAVDGLLRSYGRDWPRRGSGCKGSAKLTDNPFPSPAPHCHRRIRREGKLIHSATGEQIVVEHVPPVVGIDHPNLSGQLSERKIELALK